MKTSRVSTIQCFLMALIMLFSPLFVAADTVVMFSESLIDSQGDRLSNHTLEPKSGEQNKLESCHEHVGVNNLEQASEMPNDCCKDVCMCDQAGCHPPLAAFDSGKSVFSATSSTFLSAFQYYLSPSFTPSSPPPIV